MAKMPDTIPIAGGRPIGAMAAHRLSLAADPKRSYRHLLDTSMISSLRRSSMMA